MNKKFIHLLFPWFTGLLVILPVILPLLKPGLFRVHDYTHVVRLSEMYQTIQDGNFPPRWSKNLGFGYGMPLFSFYAPLPYYFGVVFHFIGLDYVTSVKVLYIFSFYFTFVGIYYLSKHFFSASAAYVSAFLSIFVPYRAVDVYVRGALGELYGVLCIILALNCVVKLADSRQKKWYILTALSLTGVWLSHIIMALIGIPFIMLFGFWYSKSINRLLLSLVWSIGLASFFIFPAYFEKSYTSVDQLTMGGGDYSQHFVYLRQLFQSTFGYGGSIEGPYDGISFEIGKMQILFIILVFITLVIKRNQLSSKQKNIMEYGLASFGLSVFLMSFHSLFFWNSLPLLKYLQFPWRLLTITLIVIPFISGSVIDALIPIKFRFISSVLLCFIIAGITITLFRPDPTQHLNSMIYSTEPSYIQSEMSKVIPDYIHPRLSHLVLSQTKDIELPSTRFIVEGKDNPKITILEDKSQSFKVSVQTAKPFTFTANIFDFPTWQWKINGSVVDHEVGKILPVMEINEKNTGTFIIEAELIETSLRKAADWISLISVILIGLVGVFPRFIRKHEL
jgi:hypothetical protein